MLLEYGVSQVYAVDVGTDQLHSSLRGDSRIVSMEQTDIRTLTAKDFSQPVNVVVCDVSFLPLAAIIDAILACG